MISSLPRAGRTAAARHFPLLLALVFIGALAAIGALLAYAMFTTSDAGDFHHGGAYGVGQEAPTSFGAITVTDVQMLAGLSAADLSGVTHGIQNLVTPENVQVQLSIVLSNRGKRPVDYSLTQQFRLLNDSGDELDRQPGLITRPGKLTGYSSLTSTLRYVAPRTGSHLWLEYQDPGSSRRVHFTLGTTDQAPEGALDDYHDHDSKEVPSP